MKAILKYYHIFRNICLSLRPNTTREKLLKLWRHECEFIYGQRLVSPVDFDRYQQAFVTAARKEFSTEDLVCSCFSETFLITYKYRVRECIHNLSE